MKITTAVRDHLRADIGIRALVGQRVYKRRAPQRCGFPRIIVSVAAAQFPTRSQAQRSDDVSHHIEARVQVDSWSLDEEEVDRVSEAVAKSLDDFTGTTQGVSIKRSLQDDERDNYQPLQDGSDEGAHRITQDYNIVYLEPTV